MVSHGYGRFCFGSCFGNTGIFKQKVFPVQVHLYDLSNGMAIRLTPVLLGSGGQQLNGIWHTGTVVFGEEFYYTNEGVLRSKPARTHLGPPRRTLHMGNTKVPRDKFFTHLDDLSNTTYRPQDYHIIQHNANKFTDELICFLNDSHLPNYVTFLPTEIPKRLLRFMGSVSGNVPGESTPSSRAHCSTSSGHTAEESHMTIYTINSVMFLSSSSPDQEGDPFNGTKIFPVRLYIYELSQGLVKFLPSSIRGTNLTGIWHTGIVVYRLEFFYSSEGIKICQPNGTILGDPSQTADLGETQIPFDKFMAYLQHLSVTSFRPEDYNLLTYNCNTFSEVMAMHLTDEKIPTFIVQQTAKVYESPFMTAVDKVINETKDLVVNPLEVFVKESIAAIQPMSIKDFIMRRAITGQLPFVDDN